MWKVFALELVKGLVTTSAKPASIVQFCIREPLSIDHVVQFHTHCIATEAAHLRTRRRLLLLEHAPVLGRDVPLIGYVSRNLVLDWRWVALLYCRLAFSVFRVC